MKPETLCPCDSGKPYGACCQPWHAGAAAATPGALMRSRYSAYVLGLEPYLLATWHPRTRPAAVELSPATKWLGLSVKQEQSTGEASGEVEFVARYREGGGSAVRLHERSRFVREDGRWFYLDGEQF